MVGTILAAVLLALLGLWLAFGTLGLIVNVLGWILVVVAAIWVIQMLTSRSGPRV